MSLGFDASCAVRLRDCAMTFMTEAGVRARVTNFFFDNDTLELRVELVRVFVKNCNAGVFEHAPLFPQGPPSLGASVYLELWGPPGGRSIVYWMRGAVSAPPM